MRPLPGGLPGLEHREAAQPQDLHHGHPGHVRDGRADHSTSSRTRRSCARPTASTTRPCRPRPPGDADRRHGHPVRRGLGLRDLRRVRRGLPGPHRARRQDRRPAPEPGPRGEPLPERADRRVPGDGEPGQPVGPAVVGAARLDEAAAVRGADRRRRWPPPAGSTSSRSCTGSAARPPSTRATRRSPARSPRACTRPASGSRSSARRSRAPAIRPAGWATTTSSRCSRWATSRRSTSTGWASARSSPPARTASTRSATSTASWAGTTRSSTTRRSSPSWSSSGRLATIPEDAGVRRPATTGRAASPSTTRATWPATTASSPRHGTCWAPPASPSPRWRSRASRRSAAAPAAAGCGWRRTAARGSTPSGPARSSRPARTTVATSCPFCMVMLSDGLAAADGGTGGQGHGHQRGPRRAIGHGRSVAPAAGHVVVARRFRSVAVLAGRCRRVRRGRVSGHCRRSGQAPGAGPGRAHPMGRRGRRGGRPIAGRSRGRAGRAGRRLGAGSRRQQQAGAHGGHGRGGRHAAGRDAAGRRGSLAGRYDGDRTPDLRAAGSRRDQGRCSGAVQPTAPPSGSPPHG